MIVTVARKEFRGVLRDGRVLASAGVLLLLSLVTSEPPAAPGPGRRCGRRGGGGGDVLDQHLVPRVRVRDPA